MLISLYTAENWWKDVSAAFYADGETSEIKELLLPGKIELRLGAGEQKRRNPKPRGSIARTLVESVAICLGVTMEYQQA